MHTVESKPNFEGKIVEIPLLNASCTCGCTEGGCGCGCAAPQERDELTLRSLRVHVADTNVVPRRDA